LLPIDTEVQVIQLQKASLLPARHGHQLMLWAMNDIPNSMNSASTQQHKTR